jgi:PAS domain S-box-containing protein
LSADRLEPHALPGGQARAYLAAIVESSVDAIKAKTLDGTIVFWNKATERMYGYTAEEAIGRNVSFVMAPERPNELAEILARIAAGERIEHYETERVRKDGTRLDVSISVSPVYDESGAIVGAATIARDITERRRIERGQRLLAAAGGALAEAGLDPAAIADGLARAVAGTLADFCAVEVLGDDGALHLAAVQDTKAELAEARRRLMAEQPLRVGEGLGGRIVETGEPMLVPVVDPDALRGAMAERHRSQADLLRIGSLLGCRCGRTGGGWARCSSAATTPCGPSPIRTSSWSRS